MNMRRGILFLLGLSIGVLPGTGRTADTPFWADWGLGPHPVGFRLFTVEDDSRTEVLRDESEIGVGRKDAARAIRIYMWYPARTAGPSPLILGDYVRMAAEDFYPPAGGNEGYLNPPRIPVQLAKGMQRDSLLRLLKRTMAAFPEAKPADGRFPLIVVGQGLFYESPFTHVVLCEYLASHGYIVASCPLKGTNYRLVNLKLADLETEVRDMEFVIAQVRRRPVVDPGRIGVIGFDLGGMAGLLLSMRNSDVGAFVSLDAGVLFPHHSGLPNSHPSYDESRFRIPWLHANQAGDVEEARKKPGASSLLDRKSYGNSYLMLVRTASHGDLTSYAQFGLERAVPAYWGPIQGDPEECYRAICRASRLFLDGYLKKDPAALRGLEGDAPKAGAAPPVYTLEKKTGKPAPPHADSLARLIIEGGMDQARPWIQRARQESPGTAPIPEDVLNWLGLHFLYWWGRESESVAVFELMVELFPKSDEAYIRLGASYVNTGKTEKAVEIYKRALVLNPENKSAKAMLLRLEEKK